jgi:hypothetical protein
MLRLLLKIAQDLGYTLGDLCERITEEELMIWNAYYLLQHEEAGKPR